MNSDEEPKIRAMVVLEVIGKPPEHLAEVLEKVIGEIDKEKGVTVIGKNIKDPKPLKENENFFTAFAEVELEVDEIINLVIVMFKFMPAHLEIIFPEILAISNNSWGDILNELARRMHGYDEIARMLQHENKTLKSQIEGITGKQVVTPMTLKAEVKDPKDLKKFNPPKSKVKKKKKNPTIKARGVGRAVQKKILPAKMVKM